MHSFFNKQFDKKVLIILPGEHFISNEDIILQTLLGSCISVCMYSDYDGLIGMNHFMLPGKINPEQFHKSDYGRYGMYAMDKLIGEFIQRGIKKENLKTKVFGGANILNFGRESETISSYNIKFIINYLDRENIPIISSHLGGNKSRKILFFSSTKKVFLKEMSGREENKVVMEEIFYKNKIVEKTTKQDIILFN